MFLMSVTMDSKTHNDFQISMIPLKSVNGKSMVIGYLYISHTIYQTVKDISTYTIS